ncbi:MAG: hypothetical protein XD60_1392 [Acetothermia bacterium 64_32]|nr:MAG: hypothetical protein XD60_1392 [Acetothermia bacterium 64_32]
MGLEHAVDGGRTQLKKELLRLRPDREPPSPVGHGHDLRKKGGQTLGADAPAGFPNGKQGGLYIGGVKPWLSPLIKVLGAVAVAKEADCRLTLVAC